MTVQGSPSHSETISVTDWRVPVRVTVLVAKWNPEITDRLLWGVESVFAEAGLQKFQDDWNINWWKRRQQPSRPGMSPLTGPQPPDTTPFPTPPDGTFEFGKAYWRVVHVPGTYELPLAASWAIYGANRKGVQDFALRGGVALGCVLKGETRHNDLVADACTKGISDLNLRWRLPVTLGLLATDTQELALARSQTHSGGVNRGAEAGSALLEMLQLRRVGQPLSEW